MTIMNTQLDRCQEVNSGKVFEINLNGQSLEQVPSLKEVSRLSHVMMKIKILLTGNNTLV